MLRSGQTTRVLKQTFAQPSPCHARLNVARVSTTRRTLFEVTNQSSAAAVSPAAAHRKSSPDIQPLANPRQSDMDESFIGKTGGEIFHEMMVRHGVKHIFGYPGGAILSVFDAIYNSAHFDFILPRHEQGAGHMAEGYARVSGKSGVVLVTSGPGATNVVTPLADALADGIPMVVFCGQVATTALGSDAFQEVDIIGISRPCTKWNVMVTSIAELPRRINEAFEIATSGRPGPVLVDLPKDITAGILRRAIPTESAIPPTPSMTMERNRRQLNASLRRVADLLKIAKKPVIYAGHGVVTSKGAPRLLRALANKASIPVTTSLHGLGAFDELDEKALHMLGLHGAAYANMAIQEADLIIALGARFDDRVTCNVSKFAPAARKAAENGSGGIVHFEIVPKNINKTVQATEAIEGDVGTNLALFLPLVEARPMSDPDRQAWFNQINEWKARWPLSDYGQSERAGMIKPQALIEELSNLTARRKETTIISTGVGQHQMWAAQHFRWRFPRTLVTSGGLGTMGYGLPAAIGAKLARPDALVIDIDGDASFNMTMTELATAQQFNVGVKVIILNNGEQGMVTQLQNMFYQDRYAHTHHVNPDFMKLADSMGLLHRRRVSTPDELTESLQWLIDIDGPAVLEVVTDRKVRVLPMVPQSAGLHEFITWDSGKDVERRQLMRDRTGGLYG
ncbi:thiamine diphosphate-binding protein [Achaetomium macrosporum]|uniref:Acetolactate synthase n=1 Tax=Achaetomium macrosporum TaxID=79813 RepID=A0AAN7HAA6_9PEZI|nr:thiamine diphosphate-binding protein [Achaetomium macrosporum]